MSDNEVISLRPDDAVYHIKSVLTPSLAPSRAGLVVRVTGAAVVTLDEHHRHSATPFLLFCRVRPPEPEQRRMLVYNRGSSRSLTLTRASIRLINSSRSSNVYLLSSSLSSTAFLFLFIHSHSHGRICYMLDVFTYFPHGAFMAHHMALLFSHINSIYSVVQLNLSKRNSVLNILSLLSIYLSLMVHIVIYYRHYRLFFT